MVPMENEDLVVMMEAGYLYLAMQKYKEAKAVFAGASVLAPNTEVPLVALGSVCFAQEKFDQALKWYEKALKVSPDSPFAKSYYGEALYFKGKKAQATTVLTEAIELDQNGESAAFAQALLDAIKNGFEPPKRSNKRGKS